MLLFHHIKVIGGLTVKNQAHIKVSNKESLNHSVTFVNSDGHHTSKIEGHWRHAKAVLPSFGRRKYHVASYLAEFMWRYEHKGDDCFHEIMCAIGSIQYENGKQFSLAVPENI